ncbi:MAG: chemotaxis response regulator protein-glutamate methylesterase [Firmicutes bacterium]|nr:chemotaxis response regulator protein-glutamate methylesterase [Bacillota bacterium]
MKRAIRVLVVDDSALMRQMLSRFLSEAGMEVVGTARDGVEGLALALQLKPDVITLDVEMPRLDGLGMLRRLMEIEPMRVVMVSSLTQRAAPATVEALALGALDVVAKPSGGISLDLHRVRDELIDKVKIAAAARVPRPAAPERAPAEGAAVPCGERSRPAVADGIVIIGSSTGGPSALTAIFARLPKDFPLPIVVVQHMPPGFTASLANRLDGLSALTVSEAAPERIPKAGEALVAPGGVHTVFGPAGAIRLDTSPPHLGVRPSVDVTVESAVARWGRGVRLVVLTGMGMDGAKGARLVKQAGGRVIAQDEATSVVYGMPRAVVEMGLADRVCSLGDIPEALVAIAARE